MSASYRQVTGKLERGESMKDELYTVEFWKAAGSRALRTVAQAAIAAIGTTATITGVNWPIVASTAALAGVLSVLTSIATGLPEIRKDGKK